MEKIKIAIIGLGNCASSLIQGIYYYADKPQEDTTGLMHYDIGGFKPSDIEVVAAFDIDARKVGKEVNQAIFEAPNCTTVFCDGLPQTGVKVQMGAILDGVSDHMREHNDQYSFVVATQKELSQQDIIQRLQDTGTEILLNYLPLGSEQATRFYAELALQAGVAFVNNIPVFIASDPQWAKRFEDKKLPIIGDDIKAQLGATILHRTLTDLFKKRGVLLERTYQLNTGGNTDFLNMKNSDRLVSKKESKTEAVQAAMATRLEDENIHVGPSDYVPWQKDNKLAFIRLEGKLFGDVPMNIEIRLSVEDSPNSAGVAIDSIRLAKLALDRGIGGVLEGPSAYFCKHPPVQFPDDEAFQMVNNFIGKQAKPPLAAVPTAAND